TGPTGPTGATGANGTTGTNGPTGSTGPTGVGGASFEFSTGGKNLPTNQFVGLGGISSSEGSVQQTVAPSGTLTKMTCFQDGISKFTLIYTLRKNGKSVQECAIEAGKMTGTGLGSVAFASGDLLDVMTPGIGIPKAAGSFSVSTG